MNALTMRPVALEIQLPSGHTEALTRNQLEELLEMGRRVYEAHFPPTELQKLMQMAAESCHTSVAQMRSDTREERAVFARYLVWQKVRDFGSTLEFCASLFDKDHGTVMHGLDKLKDVPIYGKPWQMAALQEFNKRAATVGNPFGNQ